MAYPIANLRDLIPPTMSSFFLTYAPYAGYVFMLQASFKYLKSSIDYLRDTEANHMTLLIDVCGHRNYSSGTAQRNQVYDAAEVYLSTKISPKTLVFQTTKTPEQKSPRLAVTTTQEITDTFKNVKLKWRIIFPFDDDHHCCSDQSPRIELTFHKKHKDKVMESYIPYVLAQAEAIKHAEVMEDEEAMKVEDKKLKLYSYNVKRSLQNPNPTTCSNWSCVDLEHPATFKTIAMEPEVKRMIIEDLDKFMKRREFYKRVGKPWKRGYLLYGPSGTGKSSLVAAMANHLHFNIYDLHLTSFFSNDEMRKALLSTASRSIVVFEDIDCIKGSINQESVEKSMVSEAEVTLSGLLNVLDGLWSGCSDERILVLTTNHKERLDPALLRPGRMDVHIHMPYCTPRGFETLASNYLGIRDTGECHLGQEIEGLMERTNVTPAEVCEELMRGEGNADADVALEGVVNLLKRKRDESKVIVIEDERNKEPQIPKAKRQKAKDNNVSKFFRKLSKKIGISQLGSGKRRRQGWP